MVEGLPLQTEIGAELLVWIEEAVESLKETEEALHAEVMTPPRLNLMYLSTVMNV